MTRIRPLATTLINQIAAGEVVERPASVVKELVENAIDAGSTRIDVEVSQGGITGIHVADNGCGIHPEDLPLAFASHATSKLATTEDLCRIGTLGFRGEALASIGSIAQGKLQSRQAEQAMGAEITCEGGQLSPIVPWNGAPGTRIEVRHLFYNTPARRKFLKAVSTEMGHVREAFSRLLLAHLGVHGTLRHEGRLVYEVSQAMSLLDRIGLFFGTELANSLYQVQAQHDTATLGGYIGDPSCDQATSQVQYLFLNGRWVRDRGLFQEVQEAYRGLLRAGRYPVAFLFLELPPEQVDVNVHPTKAEVRFRDKDTVYQFVQRAVRERLQAADLTARMQLQTRKENQPGSVGKAGSLLASDKLPPQPFPEPPPPAAEFQTLRGAARSTTPPLVPTSPQSSADAVVPDRPRLPVAPAERFSPPPDSVPSGSAAGPRESTEAAGEGKQDVRNAIQVLDCYLVVEVPPDEVWFIDQHALHEALLFERWQERVRSGALEIQRLLIPERVELSALQATRVLEHRAALGELGFVVEDFGGNTVMLTGYPALLQKRPPQAVLRAVVDHLVTQERLPSREQLLSNLLSVMACHAAVRAGDRLSAEEITALVSRCDLAENAHHCPLGRPTMFRLSRQELDRKFRRR
jgi:DNA mismatch repair protein MutL